MSSKIFATIMLAGLCAGSALSQPKPPLTAQQIQKLDSIATQDVPKGAPGIATGIVRDGRVIYEKMAGYADLSDSTLITNKTRFNIASNGKQFTALAILELIDRKKLRLDDDFRKYLPSVLPSVKAKISVENLLTHTSGLRDVYDLWSLQGLTWWEQSFGNQDVLALVEKQRDVNFEPGSQYLYSNTNYILLALIVEKVAGTSFKAYTKALFQKLNMPNTSFEDNAKQIKGPIARAYFNFGTWSTYEWIWNICGDGNIFSTLADQLEWEKIVQGKGKTTLNRRIIQKSQQLTDNAPFKNYGYGLEFGTYKGLNYAFHEGATGAWKATVIRFPDKNTSFVTLTNTGKSIPSMQTRQMADVVFDLKDDSAYFLTKPEKTGSFVSEDTILGIFQTGSNFTFQFEKRDGTVFLKRAGRNDVKLERESDNVWHQTFDPAFKQEFTKNDKGEWQVTAYYTSHAPYSLTKVSADWSGFDFGSLNGAYRNAETGVTFQLQHKGDKNYAVSMGEGDSDEGLLVMPNKLLVNNYALEFRQASPKAFFLSGDRVRAIRFERVE